MSTKYLTTAVFEMNANVSDKQNLLEMTVELGLFSVTIQTKAL